MPLWIASVENQKIIICVLFVYGNTDFELCYQPIDMLLLACSCS